MAYKYKIFEAVTYHFIGISIFCVDAHLWTIFKDIGRNKEKGICLSNNEYISGHGWERRIMAAKYKIFMNCSKNFIRICRTQV